MKPVSLNDLVENWNWWKLSFEILVSCVNSIAGMQMYIEDFLGQADKLCELIWSIYFKLHIIYMVSVTIAPGASILSCWLIYGHFDVDHLFHILNMRSASATAFFYHIKIWKWICLNREKKHEFQFAMG